MTSQYDSLYDVTGDVRGAGTDAEVYVILHGGGKKNKQSEKIVLDGKFDR